MAQLLRAADEGKWKKWKGDRNNGGGK